MLSAFVERDLPVLVPFGDGQPFDLVVDLLGRAFLRVQCKIARISDQCLVFNGRTTDHGRGRLSYKGLADVFGVYSAHTRSVYVVPVHDVSSVEVRLRLEPARNNQRCGVRLASEYALHRWAVEDLRALVTEGVAIASPDRRLTGARLAVAEINLASSWAV